MKISKKAYYGIRTLALLAEAKESVSVHEIAKNEGMPEDFLHKILQRLKGADLVHAEKGADGGYTLARSADHITVWDIVLVLDGGLQTLKPQRLSSDSPRPKLSHCQTSMVWRSLDESIRKTFSQITLTDLIHPASIR